MKSLLTSPNREGMVSFNKVFIIALVGIWVAFWLVAIIMLLFFHGAAISGANSLSSYFAQNASLYYFRAVFSLLGATFILAALLLLLVELSPPKTQQDTKSSESGPKTEES